MCQNDLDNRFYFGPHKPNVHFHLGEKKSEAHTTTVETMSEKT